MQLAHVLCLLSRLSIFIGFRPFALRRFEQNKPYICPWPTREDCISRGSVGRVPYARASIARHIEQLRLGRRCSGTPTSGVENIAGCCCGLPPTTFPSSPSFSAAHRMTLRSFRWQSLAARSPLRWCLRHHSCCGLYGYMAATAPSRCGRHG